MICIFPPLRKKNGKQENKKTQVRNPRLRAGAQVWTPSYISSHLISILPSGKIGAARTLSLTYNNEIVNHKILKMATTESKSQGDFVSLSSLFRLVQAGRRELGLPKWVTKGTGFQNLQK